MKRILIAEDESGIRMAVGDLLTSEGYAVTAAKDGDEALALWQADPAAFDLLLLDVMMPGKSGYDVCRGVRAAGSRVPVLMLSAKSEEIDKVLGLELGADDYITKPFGIRELLARVAAALRRSEQSATPAPAAAEADFPFAGATVSVRHYRLEGTQGAEPVTELELKLLRTFAAHPDEVLSRDMLLNAVWGIDYRGTTRTLDQHIANLRRKLAAIGGRAAVATVHGVGYRYEEVRVEQV